jgi:hypothetical protein
MTETELSNVKSLMEHFAELPDPRSTINQRHLLVDAIVICVCGVLSGADGPAAIADWAKFNHEWLKQHLKLPFGIPSHDTWGGSCSAFSPRPFNVALPLGWNL